MSDEIKPALSPDVWKAMLADDEFPDGLLPPLVQIQSVRDENAVGDYLFKMVATFNAAMPDGDPRKITREHVLLIEYVCEQMAKAPVGDLDKYRRMDALAAILAALLPPNDK